VNAISLLSTLAMAMGLAAALPQILRMFMTRSSGGQSVLGWGMGLMTNLSMAYVNLFGFGAKTLMLSNVVSAVLCIAAMLLIVRFGSPEDAPVFDEDLAVTEPVQLRAVPPVAAAPIASHGVLVDMPTTEFAALRDAVLSVGEVRQRREAGGACAELTRTRRRVAVAA
jgi:hypothetical protein